MRPGEFTRARLIDLARRFKGAGPGPASAGPTTSQLESAVRRLRAQLRASEERYRTLLEHSALLVCRLDSTLTPVDLSTHLLRARTEGLGEPTDPSVDDVPFEDLLEEHLIPLAIEVFRDGEHRDLREVALRMGASRAWVDFRVAPELAPNGDVEAVLCVGTDVTDRVEASRRLAVMANTDGLTGLPNRTLLFDRLEVALRRLDRAGTGVAVLFIDLDDFKLVNDTGGHEAGDRLLETVARRLRDVIRENDTVARFGGDEFVILAEDIEEGGVLDLAGRVSDALARPADRGLRVSGSIGVGWTAVPMTAAELIKRADIAMYEAKREGHNRVVLFTPQVHSTVRERMSLATELVDALDQSEFELHFQPIVDATTQRIVAAETLLRWRRNGREIEPGSFLGVAAESMLIGSIGTWVLRAAIHQLGHWQGEGLVDDRFRLHVNVAPLQLADGRFSRDLLGLIEGMGEARRQICLEITEQMLLVDHHRALPSALQRLGELGIQMALDDFGTGSSSLAHLRRYPIGLIKVDRSFVERLPESADDHAIVRAVLALSRTLGLAVVAEGVETAAQSSLLLAAGCRYQQGFRFGRPQSADAFGDLLRSTHDSSPLSFSA